MTTFLHPRGKTWRYDFWWTNPNTAISTRYTGTTGQLTKDAADIVETQIKQRVREQAFGIATFDRTQTPTFQTWAQQHLLYVAQKKRIRRIDFAKATLRLVLQFWGKRPSKLPNVEAASSQWRAQVAAARARIESAPYHDLRLLDPITEPEWIERFEAWMCTRNLSGARKNHYRSAMSSLYRTALLPAFRKKTNVAVNPFLNIERDPVRSRETTLSLDQLRALVAAAAPHLRLAIAIAAYAPELRESSILSLRWSDIPAMTRIIVSEHKTQAHTGRPQIVPVSDGLRSVLEWARQRAPRATYVVTYNGEPVSRINTALRTAVERANKTLKKPDRLVYGVRHGGLSFHTIRHSIATLLAESGESEAIRQLVMGHASAAMTQRYTHMAAQAKSAPLERLGTALQLVDAVQGQLQNEDRKIQQNAPQSGRTRKRG